MAPLYLAMLVWMTRVEGTVLADEVVSLSIDGEVGFVETRV
jgi:hypothetical protein